MWVSQYFVVPLEKERKEVSETIKDGMVSFDKLRTSLNEFINLDQFIKCVVASIIWLI